MIKLIAIDMDATLLADDKSYESHRFKEAVLRLNQQGCLVAIASGNSHSKLIQFFDEELQELLYFCGDNGNVIVKQGTQLQITPVEAQRARQLIREINATPGYHCLVSTLETSYAAEDSPVDVLEYFHRYNTEVLSFEDVADIPLETDPLVKLAVFSKESLADMKEMVAQINATYDDVIAMTSGGNWLDVIANKGGKGMSVRYLQEKYGVSPDETMAFGDSLNDLTMMQAVTHSVAMGNADTDLQKVCRYQVGTNNDQAVVLTLEKLVENQLDPAFLEANKIEAVEALC